MSGLFPEQPLLFYPSLARRFGSDEALLLGIYAPFGQHHGSPDAAGQVQFVLRRSEWLALADFWDEERLAAVTSSLVEQGVIEAELQPNGALRVRLLAFVDSAAAATPREPPQPEPLQPEPQIAEPAPTTAPAPVATVAAAGFASRPLAAATHQITRAVSSKLLERGPAPTFGGSTGWRRGRDAAPHSQDDLQRLFDQQEVRNRQLQTMPVDWQPSATTRQLLQRHNIPKAFADDCVDEFVAYWLERDRKEISWDHVFIRQVKKEWVKTQGRQARQARLNDETIEASGERNQPDSPAQRRERITDAIMDIHDTNW